MRRKSVMVAYEYCRRVTRRASKTFYWGSSFLPQPKRRAIWAIYAFCRTVDDIVDEALKLTPAKGHLSGSVAPRKALDNWRLSLERIYRSEGFADGPVQQAWSDMLEDYPVPLRPALELLNGVEMDLTVKRYQTFDELYWYCYHVAGTVGLLTAPVFGYHDDTALVHAVELGIALQLTNILRDVGEDARRDRIYLPQEEMASFGYTEKDLVAGVVNEGFCELVRFQISRADNYYQRSQPGICMLSEDCRLAVRLSGTLYRRILDYICLNDYNVFTRRASVPLQTKLVTASAQWFLQHLPICAGESR